MQPPTWTLIRAVCHVLGLRQSASEDHPKTMMIWLDYCPKRVQGFSSIQMLVNILSKDIRESSKHGVEGQPLLALLRFMLHFLCVVSISTTVPGVMRSLV